MKSSFVALFLFLFVPVFAFAIEGNAVTGFVDAPIWSDKEIEAGQKTKLFTTLFNGENARVDFVVEFSDGKEVIGKTDVSIWPKEVKAATVDWTPSVGKFGVSAKIISTKIDGVVLEIKNTNTRKTNFNVGEDVPVKASNVNSSNTDEHTTELSKLIEKINFKSGSFGDKAKIFTVSVIDKIESWRSITESKLSISIEKVKASRKEVENMKPEVKAMSFLHLAALQIIKFIFSVGVIFYGLGIVLSIIIIRKIFRILASIFRKRGDSI